jgi:hypothetical protein
MKEIKLTQGKVALVDDEDYEYLNQFNWCAIKCGGLFYARRHENNNGKYRKVFMHRFILDAPVGYEVDHINHNGLDNQRNNIRICTISQNRSNAQSRGSSVYLGVCIMKIKYKNKTYSYITAHIAKNKKSKHLGVFKTEEEAALAYDNAAREYHGEFANLNFKQ